MHFSSVTVRLWSGFQQAQHFKVWRILESGIYSDVSAHGVALILGPALIRGNNGTFVVFFQVFK